MQMQNAQNTSNRYRDRLKSCVVFKDPQRFYQQNIQSGHCSARIAGELGGAEPPYLIGAIPSSDKFQPSRGVATIPPIAHC